MSLERLDRNPERRRTPATMQPRSAGTAGPTSYRTGAFAAGEHIIRGYFTAPSTGLPAETLDAQ